jgi:hypothetical protein
MKKESDRTRKYDWAIFAQSYFLIARLACQELLSSQGKRLSKNQKIDIPYTPADLFVAILFNIKHGIEVYIKTLSVFAYGEYNPHHDIYELFTEVKRRILDLKLKPDNSPYYDAVTQDEIDSEINDFGEIETLVLYFYNLDLLRSKMGQCFILKDAQNDVFRYPSNKAEIQIDWGTVLTAKVSDVDIREIFEKLEKLSDLFNGIGDLLARLDRRKK